MNNEANLLTCRLEKIKTQNVRKHLRASLWTNIYVKKLLILHIISDPNSLQTLILKWAEKIDEPFGSHIYPNVPTFYKKFIPAKVT